MLQVEELSYRVPQGPLLLDGVHFTARRGEWIGLIGPNGAGKTSLLRLLVGWLAPSAGRISLDGRDLASYAAQARARSIAYVPQTRGSAWDLSVREVVGLGRLAHAGSANDVAATDDALAACQLTDLAARRWHSLSGGEQARAAFARALSVRAPWLMADEPFAGLDLRHQLQMVELLDALRARGLGGLIAVHDLSLAARCCTRFLLLANGRQLGHAPLAQLHQRRLLTRAFGVRLKKLGTGRLSAFVPHGASHVRRRIAPKRQNG